MSLVTEDVINNSSLVSKRLEDSVNLGRGLVKNNIEMFSVANFVLLKKQLVVKQFVLNNVLF